MKPPQRHFLYRKSIRSVYLQKRDLIAEAIIAPKCVICETPIERSIYRNYTIQAIPAWLKRKICSEKICRSEFYRKLYTRPETHKYCVKCGKRLSRLKKAGISARCRKCFYAYWQELKNEIPQTS